MNLQQLKGFMDKAEAIVAEYAVSDVIVML